VLAQSRGQLVRNPCVQALEVDAHAKVAEQAPDLIVLGPDRLRLLGIYLGERREDMLLLGTDVDQDGVLQCVPGLLHGGSVIAARRRPQLFQAGLDAMMVIGKEERLAGTLIVE